MAAAAKPSRNLAPDDTVLVLDSTVDGGFSSIEAQAIANLGLGMELVSADRWGEMTMADFAKYRGIVLGDPDCTGDAPEIVASTARVWGPAVKGNVLVNGTDPVYHAYSGESGGTTLTNAGIAFVVADADHTGMYASLSCYFHDTAEATPVPMLDGLAAGGFTVRGVGCYDDVHLVARHPALEGLTDDGLSGWGCSVHEAFDRWPTNFTVLGMAADIGASFTASDGTIGTPYILARGTQLKTFPLSIDPAEQTLNVSQTATWTAELLDGETKEPEAGMRVGGQVISGTTEGAVLECVVTPCVTDADGQVDFTLDGEDAGGDSVQVWVDRDEDGVADVGEPTVLGTATWRSRLYALGDSFSAGEGNAPFQTGTDTNTNTCHRSIDSAYSNLLPPILPQQTPRAFVACSGAVTDDFFRSNKANAGEKAQRAKLRSNASVVTLTFGGNDAGFAWILGECVWAKFLRLGRGCNTRETVWKPTLKRIGALNGVGSAETPKPEKDTDPPSRPIHELSTVYKAIAKKAPEADIYVGGYPRLFERVRSTTKKNCVVGHLGTKPIRLRYDDIAWMNDMTDLANTIIERQVAKAQKAGVHVHYVDVRPAFAEKGLCGDHESWIYGLFFKSWRRDVNSKSFHPTKAGQKAYFRAFEAEGIAEH